MYQSKHKSKAFIKFSYDMEESEAFQDLNAPAIKILIATLKQVRFVNIGGKKKKNWIIENKNMILVPYSIYSNSPYNMNTTTITRAIDSLLAHGFISIIERGGQYEGKSSIYALSQKWLDWKSGIVFEERPKFAKKAYSKNKTE